MGFDKRTIINPQNELSSFTEYASDRYRREYDVSSMETRQWLERDVLVRDLPEFYNMGMVVDWLRNMAGHFREGQFHSDPPAEIYTRICEYHNVQPVASDLSHDVVVGVILRRLRAWQARLPLTPERMLDIAVHIAASSASLASAGSSLDVLIAACRNNNRSVMRAYLHPSEIDELILVNTTRNYLDERSPSNRAPTSAQPTIDVRELVRGMTDPPPAVAQRINAIVIPTRYIGKRPLNLDGD